MVRQERRGRVKPRFDVFEDGIDAVEREGSGARMKKRLRECAGSLTDCNYQGVPRARGGELSLKEGGV